MSQFPKDTKHMTQDEYNQQLSEHLNKIWEDFETSGSQGLDPDEVFEEIRKNLEAKQNK